VVYINRTNPCALAAAASEPVMANPTLVQYLGTVASPALFFGDETIFPGR